ncbi:MAG: YmdB family metallophosphoesterase [Deltaproteobacteria bacterium]|nr:YmdB family metallophosphoesterase [Deltaproteobacteria bacterium]
MRILILGDIFGQPGRKVIRERLAGLVEREGVELVLANGENASGGKGIMPRDAKFILDSGVAAISGGNHSFQHKDSSSLYDEDTRVVRPANYPDPCPGRGWTMVEGPGGERVGFGNLMGRVFIPFSLDCPFRAGEKMLSEMEAAGCRITIIDFHAEATAEKKALAVHLDGRAGAVVGTHTHVQTADCQILPKGTAFMTDLGMTGPHESVIGMDSRSVLKSFILGRRFPFSPASRMPCMQGCIMDFDGDGRPFGIRPVSCPQIFTGRPLSGDSGDLNPDGPGGGAPGPDGVQAGAADGGASAPGSVQNGTAVVGGKREPDPDSD